jgi:integrase
LYRRNHHNGSWVVKCADGHGGYWTRVIGQADDFDISDGTKVLDFWQAQDAAKKLARGGDDAGQAPITVDGALIDYRRDLVSRDANISNAERPRKHLTPALLATPVQLLTSKELKTWRDGLLSKLAPASINRLCNCICAALELARVHDQRIKNRDAWEVGLAGLPDAQRARNVVLPDNKVHDFIRAAYAKDYQLGLLVEVLAITGARPSQATRLLIQDLHDHPMRAKVMLPKSAKGGGRNRSQKKNLRYSVPISAALAKKLKAAASGRAADEPLLLRANGLAWPAANASSAYRSDVRAIISSIGEDPDVVTLYALRHSSIVRMLLKNIPIRLIASLHNTSVSQVEKNYSAHITEHSSDEISRAGLLPDAEPAAGNVVKLAS